MPVDVGVVAVQLGREVGELQRLVGLQALEREGLLRREAELLRDREQLAALGEEELEHQPPCLLLPRGGAYDLCHRTNVAQDRYLTSSNIYVP